MEKLTLNLLKPLKVKCTDTDCKKDLHCFQATTEMKKRDEVGVCRECGVNLVDWNRLHNRDLLDVEYTLDALKHELIRHHFWHVEIDPRALNYAARKGRTSLRAAARSRIETSIAAPNNPYDGRQTPMEGSGNPIHYAQHATASSCRKCVEYWHGVPTSVTLSTEEIEYLTDLAMKFLEERLPDLQDAGQHEPPVRKE
jgi:hypothetical protein